MCGIAGIVYKAEAGACGRALLNMLCGCQHRGPDSTGLAVYGEATDGLVFRLFLDADLSHDSGNWPARLQRVQDVCDGVKPFGFNRFLKTVTVYSGEQRDQHVANRLFRDATRLAHGPANSLHDVYPALARVDESHHIYSGNVDALSQTTRVCN